MQGFGDKCRILEKSQTGDPCKGRAGREVRACTEMDGDKSGGL